ncbi:MAG: RDD family protein [Candidatus Bathyarchaeota archaeon]|nr:RDD family protein [Candidatus Bathyarchaeota archaeon]MDH5686362.1 RDD family protein [Candidatus Bathyarchaeota archaeon]
MEGIYGQSIGKIAMRIKVTQLNGRSTDIVHALLESLGKAFLLPIDCIIGWILYPGKKQRLFNYVSETIVVKASR